MNQPAGLFPVPTGYCQLMKQQTRQLIAFKFHIMIQPIKCRRMNLELVGELSLV